MVMAAPAMAIARRLRISSSSLSQSSNANAGTPPSTARGTTYRKNVPIGTFISWQACTNTTAANSTFGIAVPSATPASPIEPTSAMLNTRFTIPVTRKPIVGRPALPNPISIGSATPRTGRKMT